MVEPDPPDRPLPAEGPPAGQPTAAAGAPHLTRGFLFADLRDYTSYVEARGDHAGAELLGRYRALVRGAVAASHGAEIKTEGDSFYVVFDSASAAVRCGQEIVAAADAAPGEPIRVGVGVHAGETVETDDGYVGSAINIAARLCAQAKAGELVVSDTVRALTRTYLDVEFEPLGSRRLKGVNEQIALYRVVPHDAIAHRKIRGRWAAARPRSWLVGLAAVALVVVLGAAAAVVWRGAGPAPSTAPSVGPGATGGAASSAPSSEPSPSANAGGPTEAELVLKSRVPPEIQEYCSRSNVEDGAAGGIASLRCNLRGSPGYGADTVWYDAFDEKTRGQMEDLVNDVTAGEDLVSAEGGAEVVLGECSAGERGAEGRWNLGSTFEGRLACYVKDGEAWILWTYEGPNIAARAVRTDGDVKSLQDWWREYAKFLY